MKIKKTVKLPDGNTKDYMVDENLTDNELLEFATANYFLDNPDKLQKEEEEIKNDPNIKQQMYGRQSAGLFIDPKPFVETPKNLFGGLEDFVFGQAQTMVDIYDAVENKGPSPFAQELAKEVKRRNKKMENKSLFQRTIRNVAQSVPLTAAGIMGGPVGAVAGTAAAALTQPQEEAGIKNRLVEGGKDTTLGLAVGGGLKAGVELGKLGGKFVGSAIDTTKQAIKGAKSRGLRGLENIKTAVHNKSKKLYEEVEKKNVYFKPEQVPIIINKIKKAVDEDQLINPRKKNEAYGMLKDFEKEFSGEEAKKMTFKKLDQYRQDLGKLVGKDIQQSGKTGSMGQMGTSMKNEIDDIILNAKEKDLVNGKNVGDILKQARSHYHEFTKLNAIEEVMEIAEEEGIDASNKYLKNLVRTRKKQSKSPFNKKEIAAIQATVKTSGAEGLLKAISGTGIDLASPTKNAYPILATLTAGSTAGVPAALAMQGAALGAKSIRRLAQQGKIDDLVKYIRSNPQEAIKVRDSIKDKKIRQRINQAIKAIAISTPNLNN